MEEKYSNVLEIFKKFLRNKNYSENTISVYFSAVKEFLLKINKDPYNLNLSELNNYLIEFKYSSTSQQNQIISALKNFYKIFLNKKEIHLSKITNLPI